MDLLRWMFFSSVFLGGAVVAAGEESLPYHMPDYGPLEPPPPRALVDVKKLLAGSKPLPKNEKPLKLLLVAGEKDHQPGEHDYPAWQKVWRRLLAKAPKTHVDVVWEFPEPGEAEKTDVLVFYQHGDWNQQRAGLIDKHLARGGGVVYIHWAVDGRGGHREFAKRIGLAGETIRYRHGPLDLDFTPGNKHPVARNFSKVRFVDESYWNLTRDQAVYENHVRLIATAKEEGEPRPQFWTVERGKGRVFVSIPGHYMWTFDDPAFRLLLMRGIAWAGYRGVDRFNDVVLLDARVERTSGED